MKYEFVGKIRKSESSREEDDSLFEAINADNDYENIGIKLNRLLNRFVEDRLRTTISDMN